MGVATVRGSSAAGRSNASQVLTACRGALVGREELTDSTVRAVHGRTPPPSSRQHLFDPDPAVSPHGPRRPGHGTLQHGPPAPARLMWAARTSSLGRSGASFWPARRRSCTVPMASGGCAQDSLTGHRAGVRSRINGVVSPDIRTPPPGNACGDRWRDEILAFHTTGGASNRPTEAVNLLIEKIRRLSVNRPSMARPPVVRVGWGRAGQTLGSGPDWRP